MERINKKDIESLLARYDEIDNELFQDLEYHYLIELQNQGVNEFREDLKRKGKIPEKDTLIVARRWSSKTGALLPVKGGGGYITFLNKMGIIIDPGYNFNNIFKNDLNFTHSNIDYIIITHNHPDHDADLKYLFNSVRSIKKKITVCLTKATRNEYRYYLNKDDFNVHIIKNTKLLEITNSNYIIKFNDAYHLEIGKDPDPKGLSIRKKPFKDNLVSITGDTRFDLKLIRDYLKTRLLIPHIGSMDRSKNHLNVKGVLTLIREIDPELVILSEFDYEEFKKGRLDVAYLLKRKTNKNVIPGDIGLQIQLEDFLIKCKCKSCNLYHWVKSGQLDFEEIIDSMNINYPDKSIIYYTSCSDI